MMLVVSICVTACKTVLEGTVTDNKTAEKIADAKISFGANTVYTNQSGNYIFDDIITGPIFITVEKDGYVKQEDMPLIIEKGDNYQDFKLIPLLPEIVVTSPANAENWVVGLQKDIKWTYKDIDGNVKIELYNSGEYLRTIDDDTECDGTYAWIIPTSIPETNTYKVRITSIKNSAIYDQSDYFTIGKAPIQTAITTDATNIAISTATINAKIKPLNNNCTITFEYGTSLSYGSTTDAIPNQVAGETETPVYANLNNLQANTLYNFRVKASSNTGVAYGENITFTTKNFSPPTIEITNPSITETSATLYAQVNANGNNTTATFNYGTTTSYGNTAATIPATITGSVATNVAATITGLTPGITYNYKLTATNAIGSTFSENYTFTTGTYNKPTVTIANATNVSQTSATLNATANANGYEATISFEYGTTTSYGNNVNATPQTITGNTDKSVTATIAGLTQGQTYFFRAKAINAGGTTFSQSNSFVANSFYPPTVTTATATNITQTTAIAGGNVTDDGGATITQRGICYATTQLPTTDNTTITASGTTGVFTCNLTGLTANTTYYVRAYATNSQGTSYGTQQSFTTLQVVTTPILTTNAVTSITQTTATCGGNITSDGGATVTARGICWSTNQNPTIGNCINYTTNGTGTGTFTSSITDLTPETTYYVRAYATNSQGTNYGTQQNFTTLQESSGGAIEMVYVQGGTYTMGCGTGQSSCGSDETPTHSVTLSNFYIGKYEVTQAQYQAVMGTNPASGYGVGDNFPVYYVSWYYAIVFCNKLSISEGKTPVYSISGSTNPDTWGTIPTSTNTTWDAATCNMNANGYRLPTEAEWEYAARGGTNYTDYYTYSGSNTTGDVAWYVDNSGSTAHAVGTKAGNKLGIYDMSGNVWEWCWDWYGSYTATAQTNPTGAGSSSDRVLRGGSWIISAFHSRVANRVNYAPSGSNYYLGFRVVRSF